MEMILAAIVGALAKLTEPTIKDEYDALKALLKHKTGDKSRIVRAVENLEEEPGSEGRQLTLKEDRGKAAMDRDEDVLRAARALFEKLGGAAAGGTHVTQMVTGSGNVFSGTGSVTIYRK
jgi:hypothetical protein